jgi:hypothetical protein
MEHRTVPSDGREQQCGEVRHVVVVDGPNVTEESRNHPTGSHPLSYMVVIPMAGELVKR